MLHMEEVEDICEQGGNAHKTWSQREDSLRFGTDTGFVGYKPQREFAGCASEFLSYIYWSLSIKVFCESITN